jgi:hypothetical protein
MTNNNLLERGTNVAYLWYLFLLLGKHIAKVFVVNRCRCSNISGNDPSHDTLLFVSGLVYYLSVLLCVGWCLGAIPVIKLRTTPAADGHEIIANLRSIS